MKYKIGGCAWENNMVIGSVWENNILIGINYSGGHMWSPWKKEFWKSIFLVKFFENNDVFLY